MIPIAEPSTGTEELERIRQVLDSGMLADGPAVRSFEEDFADYCGTTAAVATSNGTTALHAELRALGIGNGDRVLTTPFSFVATANAVRFCGATPVFADIDPETYNLDPASVREVLSEESIDALLVVHLYGLPAKLDELSEIADAHDIPLIEDAAQAHGAEFEGQRVGSIGDVGTFSFYPTKNMTTGEGGMITTSREDVADRARSFVNHGRVDGDHVSLGHNFRMSSIAAALGQTQLNRLPNFIEKRRRNAERLSKALTDMTITTPVEPADAKHVYHQYTVRHEKRDDLKRHLDESGIGAAVYYERCIHEERAYEHDDHEAPVAEQAAREVLSLPVHPGVDEADVDEIIRAISAFEETVDG